MYLELEEEQCEDSEDLTEIMANVHLNNNFLALAREVGLGVGLGGGAWARGGARG